MSAFTRSVTLCALALGAGAAWAEGGAELDGQTLRATSVRVDLLDPSESFTWDGTYPVQVFAPGDVLVGLVSPGGSVSAATHGVGVYRVEVGFDADPNVVEMETDWDIAVDGALPGEGRVWSLSWRLSGGGYGVAASYDGRFYVRVDGGDGGNHGVVVLDSRGLAGFDYFMAANRFGVSGANGRSTPQAGNSVPVRYRLYLNPPADVINTPVQADISNAGLVYDTTCEGVSRGLVTASVNFTTTVDGVYHLVCDIDQDGVFDLSSDADYHLLGLAAPGTNTVVFDGSDDRGLSPASGDYQCELYVTVGEMHYVSNDIETTFPGLRLLRYEASGEESSLPMYFNDGSLNGPFVTMPNGQAAAVSSGPDGLWSGDSEPFLPNVDARAWGNFTANSQGNEAFLDTYTWLSESPHVGLQATIINGDTDVDVDGLSDAEEQCVTGTDYTAPDSDGDGLLDGYEVALGSDPVSADSDNDGIQDQVEIGSQDAPRDTDGDGLPDIIDPDDDGDLVPTLTEGAGDVDGDELLNYLDPDDDNDGVHGKDEGGGAPESDTDGDGLPDYRDSDDDGDGLPTKLEDLDGNGDASDDDWDGDGLPNFRDSDDDDDGIPTIREDVNADGDVRNDDSDGDQLADWLDDDDDGDGVPTLAEGPGDADGDGFPNYRDQDSDADGVSDFDEYDRDQDGVSDDTDGDGRPDMQDADDDGDGISTLTERTASEEQDHDGDLIPDYLDDDDDGDTIPTLLEGGFGDDADGDLIPNHLDLESDGDGLLDEDEGIGDVDGDGRRTFLDLDSDGDGVPDEEEGLVDSDGDGLRDLEDQDDDGDTVLTKDELSGDTDGDGTVDRLDSDDDGDGISTAIEADWSSADVDDDGLSNWVDLDADGDGLSDEIEGTGDDDGDGVPNFLDPDGPFVSSFRGSGLSCSSTGSGLGGLGGVWALVAMLGVLRRRGGTR